ncbi:MAG TPA: hypothetical protein VJA00_03455, partial [Candidatus Omnitrophota bacterium]|nr:hypothetical protein [Candidatus Omnitrophota bacterium]
LAVFVEELLTPPIANVPVRFFEQRALREPAYFTYQPAPLRAVGSSTESEESEFGSLMALDADKSEEKPFTPQKSRLEETLLKNLTFETWDFQSVKNYALSQNTAQSNVTIEQALPHNLKGEIVGYTLWIWDEAGNLVARTVLPPWMLFTLESNPYLISY